MSHIYRGASSAARLAIAGLLDKAWQFPKRGTHHGKGPHVPMPETWDGNGSVPLGWTSFKGGLAEEAVFLPEEPETATKLSRLTAGEQAQLAAARAAAAPHDPEEGSPDAKPNQSR